MQRLWLVIVAFVCVACHNDVRQPVQVRFSSASGSLSEYFNKLNVQMFDSTGAKFFSKVKTQNVGEQNFGTLALDITGGTYTLVAVGHSSHNSASMATGSADRLHWRRQCVRPENVEQRTRQTIQRKHIALQRHHRPPADERGIQRKPRQIRT